MKNQKRRELFNHIKKEFLELPELLSVCGDASEYFPKRWAAKRLLGSIKVYIDGERDYFVEMPV